MQGLHLTADLRGCDVALPLMRDPTALRAHCLVAVEQAGLLAVGNLFHRFPPRGPQDGAAVLGGGVTGVVLLAESHLAVHTWPEIGGVTLDVYVCNLQNDHAAQAEALMAQLASAFAPQGATHQRLLRGV